MLVCSFYTSPAAKQIGKTFLTALLNGIRGHAGAAGRNGRSRTGSIAGTAFLESDAHVRAFPRDGQARPHRRQDGLRHETQLADKHVIKIRRLSCDICIERRYILSLVSWGVFFA